MRGETDFETYAAARGATLVRCLLVLGRDLAEAEQLATAALARLRPAWPELTRGGDVDVAMFATLLAADERRTKHRQGPPAQPARLAAVLVHVAGLERVQVCEVMGISTLQLRVWLADPALVTEVVSAAEELPAVAVPYARVLATAGRTRRRRWAASVAGVAAVVLAVSVGALVNRPTPPLRPGDALPAVHAAAEGNPASVVWWADGTLHLATAAVDVGEVRRLVAAGSGAAYVDGDGRLVAVNPDGRRTFLGIPAPRSALVSSPRLGLVAWTDAFDPAQPRLVVWDLRQGHRVSGVVVSPRTRAIGFDGGWLTFGVGLTDYAWDPHGGPARETGSGYVDDPEERTALVDVVAGTRLEQSGYFLRVVRVGKPRPALVAGFGGSLSPDGRLVLTGTAGGREPELFRARTGAQVPPRFPPEWRVRAATFVSDDRVAWLVERGTDGPAIITCGPTGCDQEAEPEGTATPLLAEDSTQ